jgi:peptidoglycan/LPS O-acetylase OafA/YrhL
MRDYMFAVTVVLLVVATLIYWLVRKTIREPVERLRKEIQKENMKPKRN